MTATVDHTGDLRARLHGTVVVPGEPGYDEARRVWNAAIGDRPALVAQCADVPDVVAALGHAREHGLEVSRCAAGHTTRPGSRPGTTPW